MGEKEGKNPESLRNPIVAPSKPHRNITLTTRSLHRSTTLAAGWAVAERAGAGRWGPGELAELKRLDNLSHCAFLPRFIES